MLTTLPSWKQMVIDLLKQRKKPSYEMAKLTHLSSSAAVVKNELIW